MSAAARLQHVSVDDYLAGELVSPVKHEYLGGFVYAMAGARNVHNLIGGNIFGSLFGRLRGSACRPYNSNTKIRVRLPNHVRFYYPDVSVVCEPNPGDDTFQDQPIVVIEVLSEKTRRIDCSEKRDAYLAIPSLHVYLLFEQSCAAAMVFRRTGQGFVEERYAGSDAVIPLTEVGANLPLSEVYERVEFAPELEAEDD